MNGNMLLKIHETQYNLRAKKLKVARSQPQPVDLSSGPVGI